MGTDNTPADQDLAAWLAARTGSPVDEVARGLEEGTRRRDFVVEELLEAGLTGGELLGLVVRLTGLDEAEARELIAAHQPGEPPR
jgi:non-ribosomal peptide synthetase component F